MNGGAPDRAAPRPPSRRQTSRPTSGRLSRSPVCASHDVFAQVSGGFGRSVGTVHACAAAVLGLLADRTRGPLKTRREHGPEDAFPGGTPSQCDRLGDGRADCSHKHGRHGVNPQVVTGPDGRLRWVSPAPPGPSSAW